MSTPTKPKTATYGAGQGPRRTIEIDLDDLTVVDDFPDVPTPSVAPTQCECGKALERATPDSLAGMPMCDWPCSSGSRWTYCSTWKRVIYYLA